MKRQINQFFDHTFIHALIANTTTTTTTTTRKRKIDSSSNNNNKKNVSNSNNSENHHQAEPFRKYSWRMCRDWHHDWHTHTKIYKYIVLCKVLELDRQVPSLWNELGLFRFKTKASRSNYPTPHLAECASLVPGVELKWGTIFHWIS